MANAEVSTKKVPELQRFLKIRGITTTNLKKTHLIDLCQAVEAINLPIDPDCATCSGDKSCTPATYGIPDPFVLDNYTSDLSYIPNISLYDVFNYLINKISTYDKRKLKAYKSCDEYRLYFDGHVQDLQFSEVRPSSDVCAFRATVKPTQKDVTYLSKSAYDVWIVCGKDIGDIKMAYCTCIGGADGACRHIGATLYEIEAFEVKSVTDGDNIWVKRPRQHDCPVPIKQLKVMKARYTSTADDYQQSSAQHFDPRCLDHRQSYTETDISDIAQSLREISPDMQVLELLDVNTPNTDVHMEEQCHECPSLFVSDILRNANTEEEFVELLSLTEENISHVETCTLTQSENKNWKELPKGQNNCIQLF
ncbi:uncharacterized protein [Argopecten irradians]|uniref:uncharacterized protein n=1 Tax=Argopecten irradians TaxID=31199 RepID=UPI0037202E88